MKIRHLFLKAFGPFSDTTLDFSGAARLHVIYGANEAGKSSALRAMADLRYGIPMRSEDNFVHDFRAMLLAGCFEDAAGQPIGLARRKGNRDTLMLAHPATGEPVAGSQVAPQLLAALTGGITREQFHTLWGLNSASLREGGKSLMRGEGELGAALFEAGSGSVGVKSMLQQLARDGERFFLPKGKNPVLNEAARQIEEARQRHKQAVTRPEQWKSLKRVHEEASDRLEDVRSRLAAQRRQLAELTELRAVEPLLGELDLAAAEWERVQGDVALPPDAGERRRAALLERAQAEAAMAEADEALAQCERQLGALHAEAPLLAHADAIDRLQADLTVVRHARAERGALEAATAAEAGELALRAARLCGADAEAAAAAVPDRLQDFLLRLPTAAEQACTEEALEQFQALGLELQHARSRCRDALQRQARLAAEELREPAAALCRMLELALAEARALGDAEAQLVQLHRQWQAHERGLDTQLKALEVDSADRLAGARWLAAAEIDGHERARADLLDAIARHAQAMQQRAADLAVQQRRRSALAATGEVVSAHTLQAARAQRDVRWGDIRQRLAAPAVEVPIAGAAGAAAPDRHPAAPGAAALIEVFERAQHEADRQADLLREGAERAAQIAECQQRIGELDEELVGLRAARAGAEQSLAALDGRWRDILAQRGLPEMPPGALREWLLRRQEALEQHGRAVEARAEHGRLERQIAGAAAALTEALRALGRGPGHGGDEGGGGAGAPDAALRGGGAAPGLRTLLAFATEVERELIAVREAIRQRAAEQARVRHDIDVAEADQAQLQARLDACRATLDAACRRVGLDEGASAPALKARFAELQQWAHEREAHLRQLERLAQLRAAEAAIGEQAAALGRLLQEPVQESLDAWLDQLAQRLARSREASRERAALQQQRATEALRRERAASNAEAAAQRLAALVRQAGVAHCDELPEAEEHSARRREAHSRLQERQTQLSRISARPAAVLREALQGRDAVALDLEKDASAAAIEQLEAEERAAIAAEQDCRSALAAIDTSDAAAQAREEMESAVARYRAGVRPWAQLKLAQALLAEAVRRHREKAQGPVVALAGEYFGLMTSGRFTRLLVDADGDTPMLMAQPAGGGRPVPIPALSEGTADQLYLALRLAALEVQRTPERTMPLVLDDVFMTADDERAAHMFRALERFAAQGQVLVFTHHRHLGDIAERSVAPDALRTHRLPDAFRRGD